MPDSPSQSQRLRVAVILPALDEAACLPSILSALSTAGADEIVVSDGGSTDGTPDLAERHGARVVLGSAGRGAQLNRGAAATTAEILLFLHADTVLPDGALEGLRSAVASGAVGGGFCVRFASERPIFALGSRIVNLRTRLSGLPLGDQAQFATRAAFEALGGFRAWPILEDLDFARRLKRLGRVAVLSPAVRTSARRFERGGILRTLVNNWWIFARFFCGASPERLAHRYRPQREIAQAERRTTPRATPEESAQAPARSSTCTVKPS